ncbi:MAG: hypothetical protein LC798_13430 [Chloroflexi bacterium]|nr:hypothetical protein [Chloroflexota bacterium]
MPEASTISSKVARYGVILALYPGDATFWMQVEFAPEVGGAPDEATLVILERVAPGTRHYIHTRSPSTEFAYYRARHVGDGFTDGNPTPWIRAQPVKLPEDIPLVLAATTSAPLIDFDLLLNKATGAVTIDVNGEPVVASVRWAHSLTDWPTEGAIAGGTAVDTDANGDAEIVDAFTMQPGDVAYVAVRFYDSAGGMGLVVGTLRHAADYDDIFSGDDPTHPWSMGGSFLELPRVTWKIPTHVIGLRLIELREGASWATGTKVWEGLAEEYTGSIDDVGTGLLYDSRSLHFWLGAYYLNGTFAEVDDVLLINAPPNANATTITARHVRGNITVEFADFALCNASYLRFHHSLVDGFIPSNSSIAASFGQFPRSDGLIGDPLTPATKFTFALPGFDPNLTKYVLDGSQVLHLRVQMWDELTPRLGEPPSMSDEMDIFLLPIETEDVELPNDPSELSSLDVKLFGSKLIVKAQFVSWPPGGKLVLRRDPSNTSNTAWNALSESQKQDKWNAGTDLGRTSSGDWQSEASISSRTQSVMGRSQALNGALGAEILHGYVEDLAPNPGALTITVKATGREIQVEVPSAEAGRATWYRLHASTTNGFTPAESTVVTQFVSGDAFHVLAGSLQALASGHWTLKYRVSDALTMGTTIYMKLEAKDALTTVLGEATAYSPQFSHVLSKIPTTDTFSLTPGPPTNSPVATGLAVRNNDDGSVDWQLQFSYTQGTLPADSIIVYSKQGELTAPTDTNDPVMIAARNGAMLYEIKGVDGNKFWSFGVAAARTTTNGLEKTAIVSPGSSPDWQGRAQGFGNFNENIAGTFAGDVETGAGKANDGLDSDGDLIADIFGPTDLIGDGKLYVSLGGALHVGTGASPTARTKILRLPHSALSPMNDLQAFSQSFAGYVQPRSAGVTCDFRYPLWLPPGVTITTVRFHVFRSTTSDQAVFDVYRTTTSGSSTNLASGGGTTTGWQTSVFTFSEHVASTDNFSIHVQLLGSAAAADARLQYVEVEYTMPQYEFSL